MRRPTLPTILSIVRRRCESSWNLAPVQYSLPGALDVDRVPPVDHDLRDLGITDERLERPEPQDAVADLTDDEQLLLGRETGLLLVEQLAEALVDQALELGIGERRIVQARSENLDEPLLDARPDLRDAVPLRCLRESICE